MQPKYCPKRLFLILLSFLPVFVVLFLLGWALPVQAANGNYALDFDGSSDYADFPALSDIIGTSWQTTKTVSVWVRPTAAAPVGNIESGAMVLGDFPRWFGIYQANYAGQDRLWVYNHDNSTADFIGIPYTLGEWVHITMVHANGTITAYKNGVLVGSVPTGPTANGHPGAIGGIRLRIGGSVQVDNTFPYNNCWHTLFTGEIDEVQIWNAPRTQAQIRQGMYQELAGNEANLRAYYSMSDGAGTTLTDDSVFAWDGSLEDGRAATGCSGAPPDGDVAEWRASGAFVGPRQALDFDGVDDYVDFGTNGAALLGAGWAGTKSVDVWLKPTGLAPVVVGASLGAHIVGGPGWGISQAAIGGQDQLWLWNNDGSEDRIGITYTVNAWTHISLVHNGGTLTAYQEGTAVGSIASSTTISDGNLTIGGLPSGQPFQGQIDELRFWNDARTLLELQENMFQTVSFNDAGLAAYYRFDQDNDATTTAVLDSTGNAWNGVMTNMDPAMDWVASTAFNTWVGGEGTAWLNGQNWSQYDSAIDNRGITRYAGSHTATITSSVSVTNAVVTLGANLLVTDTLTVNGALYSLGAIEAANLSVAAGALLELHPGGWLTVTGALQNNGTLKQTQAVGGSGTVGFFDQGGYGGVIIDPAGQNLGDTAVTIRGDQDCTDQPGETVRRCFDVAPAILPGSGVTMTFAYADSELSGNTCISMNVYHWTGSGWEALPAAARSCVPPLYTVTVTDVVNFSPFVLQSSSPTAVRLQSFSATAGGMERLLLMPLILLLSGTIGGVIYRKYRQEQSVAA